MRRFVPVLALLAAGISPALAAQTAAAPATRIQPSEIDGYLRFLSSDLLEGRAPATRGGRLTTEYIASQLRAFGLRPGANGSYFQSVPIDVVTTDQSSVQVSATGKATARLRNPDEVVVWAGSATPQSRASGELVFAGYGITAPEQRWDDFKGMDLRGKILLVLVNDPPAPANEPNLFGGRAMTYYGRWTYKFEEAERRGAAGMLIVHTTEQAGYPWHTVVGSWTTPQRMLPRMPQMPAPLGFRGWVTDSAATALLRQAGLDLGELRQRAASRGFRPVPTGITLNVGFQNRVENQRSNNVVAVVPGTDARAKNEYVVFTSHWDHIGIGPAVNGDSIYNGASDNASGTADLLAVARAAAKMPARRSMLFAFVTAEESGLLGSEWLASYSPVPLANIVANINVDGGNLLGRVRDLRVLGDTKSSLGPMLARRIAASGMRITPDEFPERGYFYRSDHFSFARAGVPSVSIGNGTDVIGRPAGWGTQQNEEYTAKRYHQPSDEYRPDLDLSGAAQLAEVVLDFGRSLANGTVAPTWSPGAEFRRPAAPTTTRR